nr:uncharacterized protein LOC125421641 [Ziziphus jujuba var. spinosa]
MLFNGVVDRHSEFVAFINDKDARLGNGEATQRRSWLPPSSSSYKINIDGAVSMARGMVRAGVLVRDCSDQLTGVLAKPIFQPREALAAELLAVKEAIMSCLKAGSEGGELVTDSSEVVRLLTRNQPYLGMEYHLV